LHGCSHDDHFLAFLTFVKHRPFSAHVLPAREEPA
jgi:hypothetical protein